MATESEKALEKSYYLQREDLQERYKRKRNRKIIYVSNNHYF